MEVRQLQLHPPGLDLREIKDGVSNQAHAVLTKGLQFLREALPRLTKLAVLWNPSNEASALGWRINEDHVRALGMTAISGPIANSAELEPVAIPWSIYGRR
jgi:hypothetical protein